MHQIKSPNRVPEALEDLPRIFLAGSIEMGKAENWQERLANDLQFYDVALMNPRRDDWDASWEQRYDNPQFKEQVDWELDQLEDASLIIMYFQPGTYSPITLLELGLFLESKPMIVCCPDGFWRKGNVEIVAKRYKYGVYFCESYEALLAATERWLRENT